jgi:hypothetical protein
LLALSQGIEYGEAAGEGLFSSRKISESLTHPDWCFVARIRLPWDLYQGTAFSRSMKGDVNRNIPPPTGCGIFCLDSQPPLSSWPPPHAVFLPCRQRRERVPPPSLWECGNRALLFLARFPSAVESMEKSENTEATALAMDGLFHAFHGASFPQRRRGAELPPPAPFPSAPGSEARQQERISKSRCFILTVVTAPAVAEAGRAQPVGQSQRMVLSETRA